MVKEGKYKEALDIIMQDLPLPGILGRICPAGCEDSCRRAELDEPVSIRALKRLAADMYDPRDVPIACAPTRQEKVAIIGSGPAGLSAAYHLARKGIQSVIFEAQSKPGGMLRMGIPEHRLPRDVLDQEIELITNLGVEIKTNTPLGPDLGLNDLFNDGYKAVYLAIGAHAGMDLGIPGEKAKGVRQGVDFLRELNLTGSADVGRKVAIIGGGNVAVDVARSALRLGAEEVTIVYRRTCDEMPALPEEVEAAECEGITFSYLAAPQMILTRDGKVVGVRCIRMELGEPDSSGRRRPVPIPESEFDLEVDQVIPAIGQKPDLSALESIEGLDYTRWGTVEVDPTTYATGTEGVFAGGDLQTGPWVAIGAVAAGREAAESIARYIEGRDMAEGREPTAPMDREPECRPLPEDEPQARRALMPELAMEDRQCSFKEVELGFDPESGTKEAERCLNCGVCCECFQCVEACQPQAIEHFQEKEIRELDAGAVIMSTGFVPFDPRPYDNYAYSRFDNVVTAMEFERILAATGPWMGHLVRPSDEKEPKKIAFLQCVGSRDINKCDHPYCSSVCCMYAIKESVIAKEHAGDHLDVAIFFMDMRTYGKDFERYYNKAQEDGVRFIRSRVHSITENPDSTLSLEYIDDPGNRLTEDFDIVVLSVGMQPDQTAVETAEKMGIELNKSNFVQTDDFSPVSTSRPGIYVSGVIQGCKDIPQSVVEASAAACNAGIALSDSRGTLVKEKVFPEEKDISDQEVRIGVFVCNCGSNIGGIADVPSIAEYAKTLPHVVYVEENQFTCSQDTQENIARVIRENDLNRVVVAACTPRTHEPLFQETIRDSGLNPYLFEMANIRNQCTWVHSKEPEMATHKAKDLVRMAIARAGLLKPLQRPSIAVNNKALVIGGGVTGLTTALSLADQGFPTSLIEQSERLGGNASNLLKTWQGSDIAGNVQQMIQRAENHPNLDVYTKATIQDSSGFVGNFSTTISSNGSEKTLDHGAVIIAVGADEHKPNEYLYGQDERVLTHLDFDAAYKNGDSKIDEAETAVFVQCVGSREPDRPYCSKVCCTHSIKSALALKEKKPDMKVIVLYRDIRTYGEREELYTKARELGVLFIRYDLENKPEVLQEGSDLLVTVKDHILEQDIAIKADLLILATAIIPRDNDALAKLYKVSLNEDKFFMEAHPKLRPVEFATEGVFLAGLAHYPKPIEESIAQAKAAAGRAATVLCREEITVDGAVSHVNEALCRACGACVEACPFSAIELRDLEEGKQAAHVQAALCKGCGSCAVACPTGAASVYHFEDDKVLNMVEEALAENG